MLLLLYQLGILCQEMKQPRVINLGLRFNLRIVLGLVLTPGELQYSAAHTERFAQ